MISLLDLLKQAWRTFPPCVLPLWRQAILSLVSRRSVFGGCVLCLGLGLLQSIITRTKSIIAKFHVFGLGLKPCVLDSNSGCDIDK